MSNTFPLLFCLAVSVLVGCRGQRTLRGFDVPAVHAHSSAVLNGSLSSVSILASLSSGGDVMSVELQHNGSIRRYTLYAHSAYSENSSREEISIVGSRPLASTRVRTFRSRTNRVWASATMLSNGSVVGLFEHGGSALQVQPFYPQIESIDVNKSQPLMDKNTERSEARMDVQKHGVIVRAKVQVEGMDGSATVWYPGCYNGDSELHKFLIGVIIDVPAWEKYGSEAEHRVISDVTFASFFYERQMNIRLEIASLKIYTSAAGAPSYAQGCSDSIYEKLAGLKNDAGSFFGGNIDNVHGATHLFSGCHLERAGLAYKPHEWRVFGQFAGICSRWGYNTGVTMMDFKAWTSNGEIDTTWRWFAHELGHNFGAEHSFEEGEKTTGGIMDYGDFGRVDGFIQFNTKYRKQEVCYVLNAVVNKCDANFVNAASISGSNDWLHCWYSNMHTCGEMCCCDKGFVYDKFRKQCT